MHRGLKFLGIEAIVLESLVQDADVSKVGILLVVNRVHVNCILLPSKLIRATLLAMIV